MKREADRLATHGKDITDAKEMYEALVDKTSVKMFNIPDEDIRKVDSKIPPNLRSVKGTMDIHQLLFSGDMFNHRVASCFCKANCTCYGLEKSAKEHLLQPRANKDNRKTPESDIACSQTEEEITVENVYPDPSIIKKWCVVRYDGKPYPGLITDYDENSVEVTKMSRIGKNRFFWPAREGKIWYSYDDTISIIPPPTQVTSRHVEVNKQYWQFILEIEGC